MLCWREFNPVQWNRQLKITASSQTTSLDSFTPSPPSGCCHTVLQWSPTPPWARQATLAAHPHPPWGHLPPQLSTGAAWELHLSSTELLPSTALLLSYPPAAGPGGRHLHSPPGQARHSIPPSPSLQLYRCWFWQNNPVPLCLIRVWFKSRYEISHLKIKGQIQISPSLNITESGSFTL